MLSAPMRLRCEYLINPLGIDETRPRLSWWVADERPAEIQTAYHLLAASAAERLAADDGDLWDTGRVESQQTFNVEYRGRRLSSGDRVWWKVRTFDSDGLPGPWSDPAHFEIGLLDEQQWQARWISAPISGSRATAVQVPVLRRTFNLPQDVGAARLHVTALGVYRAEINGMPVSDDQLAPGWTHYGKRVRYQTYDISDLLHRGANAVGVLLGDGWYCGNPGTGQRQHYGDRPQLLAQLDITLESGERLLIGTDRQWIWQPSWLLVADVVDGESSDGRQYRHGWSEPDIDGTGWLPVVEEPRSGIALSATMSPTISVHRELAPVAAPDGRQSPLGSSLVYDFGENMLGRVRVKMRLPAGAMVRVRYAQALDPSGGLVGDQHANDCYTAAGDPDGETFESVFSLHGFQYVELSGDLAGEQTPELTAVAVNTRLDTSGAFNCDHGALNELFANIQRNQRACALDVPMAGLAGGQRLAITGEARSFLQSVAFNFDVAAFYRKWLDDLADAQLADGGIPPVVPSPPRASDLQDDAGPGWADVVVGCAWTLYRHFGDRRALQAHYPVVRALVLGMTRRWPEHICEAVPQRVSGDERAPLAQVHATALYFQCAKLAARIAGVLGMLNHLEEYDELAHGIRSAFRRHFITAAGRMVGEDVPGYVLGLHLGLFEGAERRAAFRALVQRLETEHVPSVNPLTAPYLLQVLTRGGRVDLAYRLLLQTRRGGWLYPVLHGATTLWDVDGEALSRAALGSIGEWLFTGIAGMDLDADLSESANAFRRMRIQPKPPLGMGLGGGGAPIRWACTSLDTVNGRFSSEWEIMEESFRLRVLVPANCSALVVLPDGTESDVASGFHEFQMPFSQASDGIPVLREVSDAS